MRSEVSAFFSCLRLNVQSDELFHLSTILGQGIKDVAISAEIDLNLAEALFRAQSKTTRQLIRFVKA